MFVSKKCSRLVHLLDRRIWIPFWGADGGVNAGVMDTGLLILIPPRGFPATFLAFF
jgi:hypothetical protein